MEKNKKSKKILEGIVFSNKMDKTIVVKVERLRRHPIYKKTVRLTKKFKAHDPNNEAKVGDKVKIIETKHYSKDKYFKLLEVVK